MPKRVKDGATTPTGKKIVAIYITEEFKKRLDVAAEKMSLPTSGFLILAANEFLRQVESDGDNKKRQCD